MLRIRSFQNPEGPALYLVATPIGNLQEVSARTREILEKADVIACEDTRVTGKLLSALDLHKPLLSHHEHNKRSSTIDILKALEQGKNVALVSDAGYPLISDPGDLLVQSVLEKEIPVIAISGPNAALNALVASGMESQHYLYYGFLQPKSAKRIKELESLKDFPFTMIFYEAPHRIEDMLKDLLEVFGDRTICLARELTKLYEEYLHGTISEIIPIASSLKGEMVVVVEGYQPVSDFEGAMKKAQEYLQEGLKMKEAARRAAEEFSLSKNEIYQALLAQKND